MANNNMLDSNENIVKHGVWIEIRKIQEYIFSTPILKVMSGANSLLGELLFHHLQELAKKRGNEWALAENNVDKYNDKPSIDIKEDNPFDAFKSGILNYLGGHFQAIFTTREGAKNFSNKAVEYAHSNVPGITIDCFIFPILKNFYDTDKKLREIKNGLCPEYIIESRVDVPLTSSWSLPCEWSGYGVAVETAKDKKVSLEVKKKYDQGEKFNKSLTKDILCFFEKELYKKIWNEFDNWKDSKTVTDFKDLIAPKKTRHDLPTGNLAIIAIDGNSYGKAMENVKKNIKEDKSYAEGNFKLELFWYKARCLMRNALGAGIKAAVDAKNHHKVKMDEIYNHLPFRILMLGGDDLLLVCAAELAFDFIIGFEKEFREKQTESSFSFSAGIAIVPVSFPFHASHELAEELLSSAKIASKNSKIDSKISYVDWHILYTGHTDSLEAIRRRDFQFTFKFENFSAASYETLLLTPKPYPITLTDNDNRVYLKRLWEAPIVKNSFNIGTKDSEETQRKLKQMRISIKQGRKKAIMDLETYFPDWKESFDMTELWHSKKMSDEWNVYVSSLYDLIEMAELKKEFVRKADFKPKLQGVG
ncbi:MAG: hypothetical protein HQK79_19875 [Desulfobacterales bacterium]|nr:hypothetical protein [Desulfobacterales bacterium]